MFEKNSLNLIDCLEGMKKLENSCIDLIISDPPYNISGTSNHIKSEEKKFSSIKENWDEIIDFEAFNTNWLTESYRVLKPKGAILVWGSRHNIYQVGYLMGKIGFQIKTHYVWYKNNAMPCLTGRNPSESTEQCIWAVKGPGWTYNLDYAKKINDGKNIREVFITNQTPPNEKTFGKHPSQKRLKDLTEHLVGLHSNEGETILVPFCGSGTECLAAKQCNRNYIAFDLDPNYLEIARLRLI